MATRNFMELLCGQWADGKFVCVGLDTDKAKIPEPSEDLELAAELVICFNREVIEATYDVASVYKPNWAFYAALGDRGIEALRETIAFIHHCAPEVPVIVDAKVADIGKTNDHYASFLLDHLGADAITVHPYLGQEALNPFLAREEKGIIVLCRTSNKGGGEFQDLVVGPEPGIDLHEPLYLRVARKFGRRHNCGLVTGATYPQELARVREVAPCTPLLIPGIGAQGGDLEQSVLAARDADKRGMIINSSSGIIFAKRQSDTETVGDAARRETLLLHRAIRLILEAAA